MKGLVHTCVHESPTCRAALVLASSAERLYDLLIMKEKDSEDAKLAHSVMAAALVEARYALRFMMASLFPGALLCA
jgi:hypothetical protein